MNDNVTVGGGAGVSLTRRRRLLFQSVVVFLGICAGEVCLRLQQVMGPVLDLQVSPVELSALRAESLNHRIRPGRRESVLDLPTVYGSHSGKRWTTTYTEDGIALNRLRPNATAGSRVMLFMGDSFMQGYDESNTIPHHVYRYLAESHSQFASMALLNAGCYSYSPSIYIPQARALLPGLRPEFVVLMIDETDLGDDFFRYRHLTTRGQDGRITAIRASPLAIHELEGLDRACSEPLYVVRAISKLVHVNVAVPRAKSEYLATHFGFVDDLPSLPLPACGSYTAQLILRPVRLADADARAQHGGAIAYFRATLQELLDTLVADGVQPHQILVVRHPYLWHFVEEPGWHRWNHVVSGTVREVAAKRSIRYYDAEPDLEEAFCGRPQDFYWSQDIHFNFDGLRVYGELVAREVEKMLSP